MSTGKSISLSDTFKRTCKYFFGSPIYLIWGLWLTLGIIIEMTKKGWDDNPPFVLAIYSFVGWLFFVCSIAGSEADLPLLEKTPFLYLLFPLLLIVFLFMWAIIHDENKKKD